MEVSVSTGDELLIHGKGLRDEVEKEIIHTALELIHIRVVTIRTEEFGVDRMLDQTAAVVRKVSPHIYQAYDQVHPSGKQARSDPSRSVLHLPDHQ